MGFMKTLRKNKTGELFMYLSRVTEGPFIRYKYEDDLSLTAFCVSVRFVGCVYIGYIHNTSHLGWRDGATLRLRDRWIGKGEVREKVGV